MISLYRYDHVIVRRECLEDRAHRRRTGGKRSRHRAALKQSERFLERGAIRVISARIIEAAREGPIGRAFEGGREVDRLGNRAGRAVDRAPGMDRESLEAPVGLLGVGH